MFPSIYLNCSDDPTALYPNLKKLLLFTKEVHIMNPHPVLLEERAQITPSTFIDLCNGDPDTGQEPILRPICRESFINSELRKDRADWANDEFDKQFMSCLQNVCGETGRILGEDDYLPVNNYTNEIFKKIGEAQYNYLQSMSQNWFDTIPQNRKDRITSIAERDKRQIEWLFVDTVLQELALKERSRAEEHAPTPLDIQATMYLNTIMRGVDAQNAVMFPSQNANWDQVCEVIDLLYPRDLISAEYLSEMSAKELFYFRHKHKAELQHLYQKTLESARVKGKRPSDMARHYAHEQIKEIEASVTRVEAGTAAVLTLFSIIAAGSLGAVVGPLGSVASLIALRAFFPRIQSEMTYQIARHFPPRHKKIIFSSCVFLEELGRHQESKLDIRKKNLKNPDIDVEK